MGHCYVYANRQAVTLHYEHVWISSGWGLEDKLCQIIMDSRVHSVPHTTSNKLCILPNTWRSRDQIRNIIFPWGWTFSGYTRICNDYLNLTWKYIYFIHRKLNLRTEQFYCGQNILRIIYYTVEIQHNFCQSYFISP